MGQVFCFSCGKAIEEAAAERAMRAGPVPMCEACREGGPQLEQAAVRWNLRRADGKTEGPLARDIIIERLGRGQLDPNDQIARVGGPYERVVTHPDFRACFIPGTPESVALESAFQAKAEAKSADAARQRRARIIAIACLIIAVAAPAIAISTGVSVLPESWLDKAGAKLGTASDAVSTGVRSAVDEEAAQEAVARAAGMPGAEVIEALQAAHPTSDHELEWALVSARRELWRGTRAGSLAAVELLEPAVAAAPEDPEAVAWLAIADAALSDREPARGVSAAALADRAEALAPGSVAATRARAAVTLVGDKPSSAYSIAASCATGEDADLACELMAAVASGDAEAIAELAARYPDVVPVGIGGAVVALRQEKWARALQIARPLVRRAGDDGRVSALLASSAAAVGLWREAGEAATRAGEADPWRLEQRRMSGEILLKVDGKAAAALEVLGALREEDGWPNFPERVRALTDASAAAVEAREPELAIELADAALAIEKAHPGAVLQKARALLQLDRGEEIEGLLASVEQTRLTGREGARFLVGAARLYTDMKRSKEAVTALDSAAELDDSWTTASLERARAELFADNPAAAIRHIRAVALLDASQAENLDPRWNNWFPDPVWSDVRKTIDTQVARDVTLTTQLPTAQGIVAWVSGDSSAEGLLRRALEEDADPLAAHAAMTWILLDRGEARAALPHIERVLAAHPQHGLFQGLRGRALAMVGRFDEAEGAFKQAETLDKSSASVRLWHAEALEANGDDEGAGALLRAVLELEPRFVGARRALVDLERSAR